ncbi:MAG: acyl carrier protein [Clostridiales bacterium]|nr:acyl carrier protein [Clostridiales bacterium]
MRDEIIATMAKRAASIFSKDEADFTADTTFEELGMKSVNYSQIIAYCEDEYDVEIPFMEFRRKKTFGEAADFIEELIEG